MFTHYLTYTFALNFQRDCSLASLGDPLKKSLLESADRMVTELGRSMVSEVAEERAKALLISVLCLRDCREIYGRAGGLPAPLKGPYEVLHSRLETLCSEAHEALERKKAQKHRLASS
jgi:hypothetical protein